jgi:uncharacterized DUF497 family protein
MNVDYDPGKDHANRVKHGVPLVFGMRVFEDADHLVLASSRPIDGEDRFKAIGMVDGRLYTVVHVWRGETIRLISVRRSNAGEQGSYIALPADADDAEDFPVSVAGLERGLMGRRIRKLRTSLGLSQEAFARTYGIPLANIRQYEIGRHMPHPQCGVSDGDRGRTGSGSAGGGEQGCVNREAGSYP